uniref:Uncharacterized protein n=1 Tax=Anguilla anguilla TaxID=7936 RepID=A0A0E9PDF7_ANGAN
MCIYRGCGPGFVPGGWVQRPGSRLPINQHQLNHTA